MEESVAGSPARVSRAGGDAVAAVRNATALAGSLVATWAIALVVRLAIPRFLGPELFGALSATDAITTAGIVFAGLGIDTYIRKEVPVRPEHSSEFFGGVLVVRALVAVVLVAALAAVLHGIGRPTVVVQLAVAFGVAQFTVSVNASLAALLHACGRVGAFSLLQILSKVLWALGILAGGLSGHLLLSVPLSLAASELLKAAVLWRLARVHVGLRFEPKARAVRDALRASVPFYLTAIVITVYGRLDQTMLPFLSPDPLEVGWYGAAAALGAISMLLSPVVGWVLLPLFARAANRSPAELEQAVSKSIEVILSAAIPVSLVLGLGADLWVGTLFGERFAAAAPALRILAPAFPFTYLGTIAGVCLNLVGRGWRVTSVTAVGLCLNATLNLFLVPRALAAGPGAAGAACATAMLTSEALVALGLSFAAAGVGFGRHTVLLLSRAALAAAAVVALDHFARPLGAARLAVDLAGWIVFAGALRAARWLEIVRFARSAWVRPNANAA